ncbi:MAG: TIGR01777 family oxidoreductase [Pirellulaceae bacterium]
MATLVTGGTGWIGRHLLPRLENAYVVSRNAGTATQRLGIEPSRVIECDLTQHTFASDQLDEIDSVVNLMGESIAEGRWTGNKKKGIRNSRINGTTNLVQSFVKSGHLPRTMISASAIGYYGDQGDDILDEASAPGDDFLANICMEWENAARPFVDAGVRVMFLRIGIVLGQGGGALEKMLTPFKMGMGGRIGSGKQWVSWIHLHDLIELIVFLLSHQNVAGPVNGTTPNPVRNSEFANTLGKVLGRPAILPVPKFTLKLAVGEFAEFLFMSQRVVPNAALNAGFEFRFPSMELALADIVGR